MGDCIEREREAEGEGEGNPERMLLSEDNLPRPGLSPVHSPYGHTGTTDRQGAPSSFQCKRQRRPKRATQEQSVVSHVGRELGKSELSWI